MDIVIGKLRVGFLIFKIYFICGGYCMFFFLVFFKNDNKCVYWYLVILCWVLIVVIYGKNRINYEIGEFIDKLEDL